MPVNNTASLRNAMRAALDEKGVSVAFGLDFGTYRSMIATYDRDSGSLAVPNYSDACLGGIPSLFWRTADGKEWVGDEAYARARRRTEHMMAHGRLYRFNVLGLMLCALRIRWKRRRHYFCSQFVSEVLEKSGAMELPKDSTLMHPNDYTKLNGLKCVFQGRLADLPQRRQMEFVPEETVVSVYLGLAMGLLRSGVCRVREIF